MANRVSLIVMMLCYANVYSLSLSLSLSPLPPVSLDLLAADVRLISQGMKQTLAEFLQNKSNKALKKFCFEAEPLATKLEADLVTAKEAFGEVVQYFGENPKLTQPNSVFPVLQRFVAGFQVKKEKRFSHPSPLPPHFLTQIHYVA